MVACPSQSFVRALSGFSPCSLAIVNVLGLRSALTNWGVPMRFQLLGPVRGWIGDRPINLGVRKQRFVLAVLALEANTMVPTSRLVDQIWPDYPPVSARRMIHTYVSGLRSLFASTGSADVELVRHPAGYELRCDPALVDTHRFLDLTDKARASEDDEQRVALLDEALSLWQGPALAGVAGDDVRTRLCHHLDEARVTATEDRADALLRLGRHEGLVDQLTVLTAEHPARQRLTRQLMLVLHRTGRTADALHGYEQARRYLADELGIVPDAELHDLYLMLLQGDADHHPPAQPPTDHADVPGRTTTDDIPVVPRQLPAPIRDFVGRDAELTDLSRLARKSTVDGASMVLLAVSGGGGIGKTALAVHWARQVADRFPDGQLYLNLRGFDPSGSPMTPAEAIRTLLDAFPVPTDRIPPGLDAQAGLYRSLLAGRRLLVLLDNARDSDQVRPLLPGTPGCLVLVTSRNQLTGLITGHGAHHVPIAALSDTEADALLSARLGADRVTAEPAAASELLTYCGGLPLALSIIGGRAQTHPHLALAAIAADLREARLDALDDDDPAASLPTVLSWSYTALTREQARVFGLLAIAPGPDISLLAAANLTGLSDASARAALRGLEQVSLIDQETPFRYRMHDLVRRYAADRATADQTPADREAACRGLVAFYLHTANTGDQILPPPRPPVELNLPSPEIFHPLTDEVAAERWFAAEHPCLLATQQFAVSQGWQHAVWQLAWVMGNFHRRRGHFHEDLVVWQAGLAAAENLAHAAGQAVAHRRLGRALARMGRRTEAFDHLHQALGWAERANAPHGQALVHHTLARLWEDCGNDERALEHATHALHLFRHVSVPAWEAIALNSVGWYRARLGDYDQAREDCEAALAGSSRHGDRHGEALATDSLGYIAHHTGEHTRAIDYYNRALTLLREHGDVYERANTLERAGHPLLALGHRARARTVWQKALELLQAQHRTADADCVRQRLRHLNTIEG
jgi:DNA-binding SARP family transcriptional activator/Tfp pilus assembly protein PilF